MWRVAEAKDISRYLRKKTGSKKANSSRNKSWEPLKCEFGPKKIGRYHWGMSRERRSGQHVVLKSRASDASSGPHGGLLLGTRGKREGNGLLGSVIWKSLSLYWQWCRYWTVESVCVWGKMNRKTLPIATLVVSFSGSSSENSGEILR